MNNQNPFNWPVQGQQSCPECGAPLDINGVCPNCAKQADPQPVFPQQTAQSFNYGQPVQPAAPQQQGYNYGQPNNFQQQQGFPQQGYPQPAPKAPAGPNLFTYALDYIKAFFSADPTSVLDKAANEKQHIWSILGSGSVLLITLGVFGILSNGINKLVDLLSGLIASMSGLPFLSGALGGSSELQSQLNDIKVKLFFFVLLSIAAFFFASAGLDMLFFNIQKKKADYVQNMNVLSAAMLPLAVCGGAAFILSFIYIPLSAVLLFAGLLCKYVMLYDGLKKVAEFGKDTVWYVFGLIASTIVAFGLIAYILSKFMF